MLAKCQDARKLWDINTLKKCNMGIGSRKDLARLDNTLSKVKNPPRKLKHYKLEEKEIVTKGPSANERLVRSANKRINTEEWRTPNEQTTRFPKLRKGINKVKSALGRKGYNEKGQTMGDTCVSFVGGVCKSSNVDFKNTYNTRDFVKDKQDKGIKPHGKWKSKPGDIVVFSKKKQNSKTHADWTGTGPRPTHMGIKNKGKNKYIGSSSGIVEEKGIFRKETRKYKKDFYTPTNLYK
jgi:hypothetical protein